MPGKRRLIIIQGRPATGKTTLARKLTKDVGATLIEKDAIKEFLADYLDVSTDFSWSNAIGKVSVDALYTLVEKTLEKDHVVVAENAFWTDIARKELGEIMARTGVDCLELYCDLDEAVRRTRFYSRIDAGDRHRVHIDAYPGKELENDTDKYRPLEIGTLVKVDTEKFGESEYETLRNQVQDWLEVKEI